MHYPTLYAFLLATSIPAATALAIRSDQQQNPSGKLPIDMARRSVDDTDDATVHKLELLQAALADHGDEARGAANPYPLIRRQGTSAEREEALTQEELRLMANLDRHSDSQTGTKSRRRRAINSFVRRSGRIIPNGSLLTTSIPDDYRIQEKHGLLDESGITSVVKGDADDDKENNDDDHDEEANFPVETAPISRRGMSAIIARRRAKRAISR